MAATCASLPPQHWAVHCRARCAESSESSHPEAVDPTFSHCLIKTGHLCQPSLAASSRHYMQQALARMAVAPWKEPLQRALKKNSNTRESRYVQLATVRPDGRPANRTVVYRGFLADTDVVTFVTDSRSRKVEEIAANPWGEVAWYFPNTREQFRLLGKLTVVDSRTEDERLQRGRVSAWKNMSDPGRQQFLWPHPGEPRHADDSVFKPEPPTNKDPVVDTFCLVCLAVHEVDYLQLGKNVRFFYRRQAAAADGAAAAASDGAAGADGAADDWSIQNINP